MERVHQIRWDAFIASCTRRDLLEEWLDALHHCERWKAAHPELTLPEPVALALQHMLDAYRQLRPMIEDRANYDQPAPTELTNQILSLTMKVKREVPAVVHLGHA